MSVCCAAGREVSGLYRVRAVDYWAQPGSYSLMEEYVEDLEDHIQSPGIASFT